MQAEVSPKDRVAGLLLIVVVAIIWICASFVVQELDLHPFLITYFCNILFLLYLPISAFHERRCRGSAQGPAEPASEELSNGGEIQPLRVEEGNLTAAAEASRSGRGTLEDKKWCSNETWLVMKAACVVAPVWYLAQLCFNISLHLTSVTSNTILSSPSSLFTYFLSVLVLHEKFTYKKLGGVLLTVAGTILVSFSDRIEDSEGDSQGAEHPIGPAVLGDLLTLAAAALYACYTVLLKIMMPEGGEGEMMAFFGYLGLCNTILFSPVLFVMQLAGVFNVWAMTSTTLSIVVVKGLFDNTLSDYLWSRAVILVGPTIATVGLQLQVPMAMLVDPLVHAKGWWSQWQACVLEVLGAAGIVLGFFIISFVA